MVCLSDISMIEAAHTSGVLILLFGVFVVPCSVCHSVESLPVKMWFHPMFVCDWRALWYLSWYFVIVIDSLSNHSVIAVQSVSVIPSLV